MCHFWHRSRAATIQIDQNYTNLPQDCLIGYTNVAFGVDRWNGLHVDRCLLLSWIFHPPRVCGSVLQDKKSEEII